ncbi:Chromosome partition protein Smc [Stieleria bergensis]|uniref:Chromosome partition protein Smc n=1 Tax=Stieleria bergensis TaxID=2528025 RepID=A0A517SVB0_9BACT|nr:Chromosome partition protein Smc [Planctomycetes bacterium SV_7m_r]
MSVDYKSQVDEGLLHRLQSLHAQVADLEGQLARGPRQIAASEAIVQQAQQALADAQQKVKDVKLACDEKQLQLSSREARIEELKAKLNTAASNKEFSLLKDQIAADTQANSVQSDEIMEAWERIDELTNLVGQAEQELTEKQSELIERTEKVQQRMNVVTSDLEHVRQQLTNAEAKLPPVMMDDYLRSTGARGEEALAPIEDGCCGVCNQMLTTQIVDRIRLKYLATCPNCSAWLYSI